MGKDAQVSEEVVSFFFGTCCWPQRRIRKSPTRCQ